MIILTIIISVALTLLVYRNHKNNIKRLDKIEAMLKEKNHG